MNKLRILLFAVLCVIGSISSIGAEAIHETWNKVLQTHVENGLVDYKRLRRDKKQLDAYLKILATADISSFTREGQLAFWINAYNAFTVELILNNCPVESIRDIKNPWKQKVWNAAGMRVSLDEIEHVKLRKEIKEPKIHFAIVCASMGCPTLWNRAYSEERIEEELDAAARKFMQARKHVQFAVTSGFLGGTQKALYLSSIFRWFGDDFTDGAKWRVQDFVMKYADEETAAFIRNAGKDLKIKYLDYDWTLNEKKR